VFKYLSLAILIPAVATLVVMVLAATLNPVLGTQPIYRSSVLISATTVDDHGRPVLIYVTQPLNWQLSPVVTESEAYTAVLAVEAQPPAYPYYYWYWRVASIRDVEELRVVVFSVNPVTSIQYVDGSISWSDARRWLDFIERNKLVEVKLGEKDYARVDRGVLQRNLHVALIAVLKKNLTLNSIGATYIAPQSYANTPFEDIILMDLLGDQDAAFITSFLRRSYEELLLHDIVSLSVAFQLSVTPVMGLRAVAVLAWFAVAVYADYRFVRDEHSFTYKLVKLASKPLTRLTRRSGGEPKP